MRAKQVYLTGDERMIIQVILSLEIRSNIKCKEMGIDPAFNTETMKNLYEKLTGRKWEDEQRR